MKSWEQQHGPSAQRSKALAIGVITALALVAGAVNADEVSDLRERLDAQEQKIRELEGKVGSADKTAKPASEPGAVVKGGPKGFSIASSDGESQLKIRGTLHFDGRYFLDDVAPDSADTWLLRRVRPSIEGTLNDIWDFRFMPDFAGGKTIVVDAYGAVRLKPWAVVTAGKFKVPVSLERLVSSNDLKFIERGFTAGLAPNRDLGVQLGGSIGGAVQYSVGLFNGVIDGGSSDAQADAELDSDRDIAARVFFQPFAESDNAALQGLGFGIAGTYVNATGLVQNPLLPSYRNPDQQRFFSWRGDNAATPGLNEATYLDGKRQRLAPQAHYYVGSFGALGEYIEVTQEVSRNTPAGLRTDELETSAWQVQLSYFLTGEKAQFKGFTPRRIFEIGGPGWGAFEVAARYQELKVDDGAFAGGVLSFADPSTQPREASAYTLGLNWYFNQNFKWQLNYEHVSYEGGAAGGADREDAEAILTRFAVGF